jgi:hypothetical protein
MGRRAHLVCKADRPLGDAPQTGVLGFDFIHRLFRSIYDELICGKDGARDGRSRPLSFTACIGGELQRFSQTE